MRCFTKQVLITFSWMKAVGHAAMDAFDSIGEERLTHARWPPQQRGSGISGANERSHPRAGRTSDNLLSGRSALAAVRGLRSDLGERRDLARRRKRRERIP